MRAASPAPQLTYLCMFRGMATVNPGLLGSYLGLALDLVRVPDLEEPSLGCDSKKDKNN